MTTKEVVALAKACRKAGIKSFKNNEIEFELHEFLPATQARRRSKKVLVPLDKIETIESGGWAKLSLEQQLYWSSESLTPEIDFSSKAVEVK